MPRRAMDTDIDAKRDYRNDNFQQIVNLAEKLVDSLAKRIQRAENIIK